MPITRQEVYTAIDSERDYQNSLTRNGVPTDGSKGVVHSPAEHLTTIRRIIRDMEDAWYDKSGVPQLDFMRKIAATAVRCMEQHGAPHRVPK